MDYEKIISDLKKGIYRPIYFLMGEEPYYIDKISNYIAANILNEEEKAFNLTILYGKDVDAAAITNAAKRYPMMSEYQVVIVREAQNVRNIDDLVYYASGPLQSTILVICYKYKKLDKRKKLYKEIAANGLIFESGKIYEDRIPEWITTHLREKGYSITPPASRLLTEFLGNDLEKIEMELGKLMITLSPSQKNVTPALIEENIGISKDYNNFELQKALVQKDTLKIFRIVDHFAHNEKDNPFTLTVTSLYYFFNKVLLYSLLKDKSRENVADKLHINPYFIADYQQASKAYPPAKTFQIIGLLREYDLKSKGVGNLSATSGDLLKELVYKILN